MNLDIKPDNFDFLCKYVSGSYLYGTNIKNSDFDWFGVYIDKIYNIGEYRILIPNDDKRLSQDEKYYELRFFYKFLEAGDFYKIETLFLKKENCNIFNDKWNIFQKNKNIFLDSEKIFNWILNYVNLELEYTKSPERNGNASPKMIERFERYGFDYASFGHTINILNKGIWFFKDDEYIINVAAKNIEVSNLIKNIKTNPSNFDKLFLDEWVNNLTEKFKKSFLYRKNNYIFDGSKVEQIISYFYRTTDQGELLI